MCDILAIEDKSSLQLNTTRDIIRDCSALSYRLWGILRDGACMLSRISLRSRNPAVMSWLHV